MRVAQLFVMVVEAIINAVSSSSRGRNEPVEMVGAIVLEQFLWGSQGPSEGS